MKRFYTIVLAVLTVAGALAADPPKRELRNTWFTTRSLVDWPSRTGLSAASAKSEMTDYLDIFKNRNFNGAAFQIRCIGDAYYASSHEPWAHTLTGTRGKDPGWDPLEYCVEQCHARGLECWAWINPFRFWVDSSTLPTTPWDKEVVNKGWIISNGGNYRVYNPGNPEVRQYLVDLVKEVYTKYRIDGIIFDDYFYPTGMPTDATAEDWSDYKRDKPTGTASGLADWRRANVNLTIQMIYEQMMQDRPDLRFGISPRGNADRSGVAHGYDPAISTGMDGQYDGIYCDPLQWYEEKTVDFISPQIYWFSYSSSHSYLANADYTKLCRWWYAVAKDCGRHCYVSIAPYRRNEDNAAYNNTAHWNDLNHQIALNRSNAEAGTTGTIPYSSKYYDGPALTGWGQSLSDNVFQYKSLTPVMTWKSTELPAAVAATKSGSSLSWPGAAQTGLDPIMRYTVYAVPENVTLEKAKLSDGDGIATKYLLDVVYGSSFTIPSAKRTGYWYAVCAYDGYGNESEPCLIDYNGSGTGGDDDDDDTGAGTTKVEHLWTKTATGLNDATGAYSRGMAAVGDVVYVSEFVSYNSGSITCRIHRFSIKTGRKLGKNDIELEDAAFRSGQGIVKDNEDNLYLTNICLNVNSAAEPVEIYKYDPTSRKATLWARLSASNVSSGRIDHCCIEKDGDTYYVYAAVSRGSMILRWTVGSTPATVTTAETCTVSSFSPADQADFGIDANVFSTCDGHVWVDGGNTAAAEYDFASGQLLNSIEDHGEAAADGYQSNGVCHFGETECHLAFAASDSESTSGIKMKMLSSKSHGISAGSQVYGPYPADKTWTANSTHMTTPVDAVTKTTNNGWESNVVYYAPGNGLSAYKVTYTASSSGSVNVICLPRWSVDGLNIIFDEATAACAYDLTGREVARSNGRVLALPATGLYIVRGAAGAVKIAVR